MKIDIQIWNKYYLLASYPKVWQFRRENE